MPYVYVLAALAAGIAAVFAAAREEALEPTSLPFQAAADTSVSSPSSTEFSKSETFSARCLAVFLEMDSRYQSFIRTHVDARLTRGERNRQLQTLVSDEKRMLSPTEKRANRNLGLGLAGVGLIGLGLLTGWPLAPLALAVGIYVNAPLFRESYRLMVEERRLSILHLLNIYTAWMWLEGQYLVGAISVLFAAGCRKIEIFTQIGARHALIDVFGQQPRKVWMDVEGVEVEVPFDQISVGDILVLNAGQVVPVDGVVVSGIAWVDQHRLTGESRPTDKSTGDPVFAATLVLGGRLRIRVEKTGAETAAAQIAEILSRTVDYGQTDLTAQYAIAEDTLAPTLAGGIAGWLTKGPETGVALLGCNYVTGVVQLRLFTLLNALRVGSSHGILVKDGRALDRLGEIEVLVFDKTGTLTLEQPRVAAIHVCGHDSEDEILALAAAAEHRQTHPIAKAILAAATERGLTVPVTDAAHYEVGYGLKVQLDGLELRVGSQRFMALEHIALPETLLTQLEHCQAEGRSLVFVAVNSRLAGALELDASLRPEAQSVVNWLRQQGLKLYIISGDQEAPTRRLARELGMDGYFANTLPEQKAELIGRLQAQGHKVGFIGDGINDAVALGRADVSISLCSAATLATDNAQIVLMDDHLDPLRVLFQLSQAYGDNLNANYRLAVGMSWVAAVGVFLLPFKFWVVELLWTADCLAGIRLASRPLLPPSPETDVPPHVSESAVS